MMYKSVTSLLFYGVTTSSWDVPWRSMVPVVPVVPVAQAPSSAPSAEGVERLDMAFWEQVPLLLIREIYGETMVKPMVKPGTSSRNPRGRSSNHGGRTMERWKAWNSPIPNYPQLSVRVVQNHHIPCLQLPVVVSAMVSDLCRYIPHKYGSMVSNTDVQQQVNKKCKLFAHHARVTWPNDRLWQTLRHLDSFTSILKHYLFSKGIPCLDLL